MTAINWIQTPTSCSRQHTKLTNCVFFGPRKPLFGSFTETILRPWIRIKILSNFFSQTVTLKIRMQKQSQTWNFQPLFKALLLTEPAEIAMSLLRACYFFNVNHLLKTSVLPSGPSKFFQRAFLLNTDIAIRQSFEGGIVSSLNDHQWEITRLPKKSSWFCQRTASKYHRAVYIASKIKKSLC